MQVQTEYYLGLCKGIIDSFRQDRDKRRFFVLFTMLLATMGMNVSNAAAIQEYGIKLDQHSSQLHDLNAKFELFVAYMSTQRDRDSQQDKRLDKLENNDKKQDKRIDTLEEENGNNNKNKNKEKNKEKEDEPS